MYRHSVKISVCSWLRYRGKKVFNNSIIFWTTKNFRKTSTRALDATESSSAAAAAASVEAGPNPRRRCEPKFLVRSHSDRVGATRKRSPKTKNFRAKQNKKTTTTTTKTGNSKDTKSWTLKSPTTRFETNRAPKPWLWCPLVSTHRPRRWASLVWTSWSRTTRQTVTIERSNWPYNWPCCRATTTRHLTTHQVRGTYPGIKPHPSLHLTSPLALEWETFCSTEAGSEAAASKISKAVGVRTWRNAFRCPRQSTSQRSWEDKVSHFSNILGIFASFGHFTSFWAVAESFCNFWFCLANNFLHLAPPKSDFLSLQFLLPTWVEFLWKASSERIPFKSGCIRRGDQPSSLSRFR